MSGGHQFGMCHYRSSNEAEEEDAFRLRGVIAESRAHFAELLTTYRSYTG